MIEVVKTIRILGPEILSVELRWSGIWPSKLNTRTRAERNAIHDRQWRSSRGYDWEATQRCMSHRKDTDFGLYLFLRYHPINICLPYIVFSLGSVVNIWEER